MTDYESIYRSCISRGVLWEDPEFPTTQSSVFYHQTPPFEFFWKRPRQLCQRPCFALPYSPTFDLATGKMGDRWFLQCLGVLYLVENLFYRVVPNDQNFNEHVYCGIFRFQLWWCGSWVEVLVDDRLPTVAGKLAFMHTVNSDQFWPSLLEKAYAKLHGSYEALKYGTFLDGIVNLTGGITETIALRQDPNVGGRLLKKTLGMASIVTCTIQNHSFLKNDDQLENGIYVGCSYRLYEFLRVSTYDGEFFYVVLLRNPLGSATDYHGSWGNESNDWNNVSPSEKSRLNINPTTDGEFWMLYSDFINTFTHLEVVHLDSHISQEEPTFETKNTWHLREFQDNWRKGVSAGGCRNHDDTFFINPQIQLAVEEMEEVIVSLYQHSIMEPKVIGFSTYLFPENCNETLPKSFFRQNKSIANSQYTNSRQVSRRCHFGVGNFVILPTTFEAGDESCFTLRVYSAKPFKLRVLDMQTTFIKSAIVKAPSQIDRSFVQYEAVFLQLADEHRTVNAFELQELLDACLPNDYIKSSASIDVCRQVVLALGDSASGRLKFADFKDLMCSLKHWQTVFKNHTKEKTGVLKGERLRDALLEVGYQVNIESLSTLILRYMRKDGTLRFGDFVSAILHVHVGFGIFAGKDLQQSGTINLKLSEWLQAALMC